MYGGGVLVCFFFSSRRRHTRSLRDWSSDVCYSDLLRRCASCVAHHACRPGRCCRPDQDALRRSRSEERRVGKECRSRWPPDHEKEHKEHIPATTRRERKKRHEHLLHLRNICL